MGLDRIEEAAIQAHLDKLRHGHRNDGDGGEAEFREGWKWYELAEPNHRRSIREVLLGQIASGTPRRWGMALAILAESASPATAAELEMVARSLPGRSEVRDSIIVALARLGHRPALDLCLEGVAAGRHFLGDGCVLLANLVRLDPETGMEAAASHFADQLSSSGSAAQQAESCSGTVVAVYACVNIGYVPELVRRTHLRSPTAGRRLVASMARWCDMLVPGYSAAASPQLESVRSLRLELGRLESDLRT